ncbi:FtsX-like permease family protein [uncultured Peptoniphilus sp.]|uniref:FtsX-like permease family protein n=1 Tax=uncultured Peptoniphilus sp. TaxID=254354 RepID=UPI0028045CBB|nr:FtsX-like permease family protein [uncultured Peptoniphilus sp.]
MKTTLKDSLREIKNTFSRFLSILLIVILGVFVLIGLISTGPVMRNTIDNAIKKNSYPDLVVSAPQSLENEDMEIIESQANLDELEYAYDLDLSIKGRTETIKILNMPIKINMPEILEGKAPQKGEIILDNKMKEMGYKIGDKISFKKEVNKFADDKKDALLSYDYRIVGFCNSLDYIMNRSRGYSERGLGEISGFAYIAPSEFNTDPSLAKIIYGDLKKFSPSSKEYKEELGKKYESLKIDMKYRPSERLSKIKGDLSRDISEGEDKITEAEEKLSDAKDELESGKKELSEGQREYSKGYREFTDQKKEGEDKLKESRNKLYKTRDELNNAKDELSDAKEKLAEGKGKLDEAKIEIDKNEEKLNSGYREYERGKGELEAGEKALKSGEEQLLEGRKKLDEGWRKIDDSKAQLEEGKNKYQKGLDDYEKGEADLEKGKEKLVATFRQMGLEVTYEEAEGLIISLEADLERLEPYANKIKTIDEEISEKNKEIKNLEDQKVEKESQIKEIDLKLANPNLKDEDRNSLNERKNSLNSELNSIEENLRRARAELSLLNQSKTEIEDFVNYLNKKYPGLNLSSDFSSLRAKVKEAKAGVLQIKDAEKKLTEGKAKLDASKIQLDEGEKQLQDGIIEAQKGEAEYKESEEKIAKNKRELEDGKEKLVKAKEKLDSGKHELEKGKAKYEEGLIDYNENYDKFLEGTSKYESGEDSYKEGEKQLREGEETFKEEIGKAEDKLKDAKSKLYKGQRDLAEGQREYEDKSLEAEEKIKDAKEDIKKGKRYLNIMKQPRYSITPLYLVNDINTYIDYSRRVDGLSLIFPVFFFAVALLVSFTTMTRMVEDERILIGTYKALGYSQKEISSKYFLYGSLASLIGGTIGGIWGSYLITYIIGNAYSTDSIFENNLLIRAYPLKIIFAIAIGFIFTAFAARMTTNKSLKEKTAQLLRPKPPKTGKRILLERIPFIWNKMSFLFKVTARNIFRSKKRMLMTVLGIIGCTALLVLGFGIKGSVGNIEKLQFEDILKYDLQISYDKDIDEGEFLAYKEFINSLKSPHKSFYQEQFKVSYPEMDQNVSLIAPEDEKGFEEYFALKSSKTGQKINLPKRGAVISQKLSKLLGIKKGDTIEIKDVYDNSFRIEVTDICEMYINHYIFMTRDYYEKVKGEDFTANTNLVKTKNAKDFDEIKDKAKDYKVVTSIIGTDLFKKALNQFLYSISKVQGVIVILSSLLAIVVLYNLTNINIEERIREIATIKVLGFYAKEVTAYVYRETYFLTIMGIILGLIIGKILHYSVLQIVVPYPVMLSSHLITRAYIYATVITLLVTTLIMLVFHFKIKKIDMVESLKSNE